MAMLATLVPGALVITAVLLLTGAWLLVLSLRRLRARLRDRVAAMLGHCVHSQVSAASPGKHPLVNVTRRQAVTLQSWLPGRSHAVAGLRCDLHRDVRGATQAVAVGLEAGRPVQSLSAVANRLQRSAASIDVDLAIIAAEPDVSRRRDLLAEQHERIETVRRACEQVRRGVLLAGSATTGPLLPGVVDDLNDEVIRLGLWARAHHELQGLDAQPGTRTGAHG